MREREALTTLLAERTNAARSCKDDISVACIQMQWLRDAFDDPKAPENLLRSIDSQIEKLFEADQRIVHEL